MNIIGESPEDVVWLPAHCGPASVGVKELSNGQKLTSIDVRCNADVDRWAKQAAASARVDERVCQQVSADFVRLKAIARWLGQVTVLASNVVKPDTEATRKVLLRDSQAAKRMNKPLTRGTKRSLAQIATASESSRGGESIDHPLAHCPRWQALRRRVLLKASAPV